MSVKESGMRAKLDGDNLVITIPTDILIFACENGPEFPLLINNQEEFLSFIEENILRFDEDESGVSHFGRMLDELFIEAYEDGIDMEEKEIE